MHRRAAAFVGAAIAVSLLLTSCAPDPQQEQAGDDTLVWVRPDPITTWEGDQCSTAISSNLMVFDSLLRISDDGQSVASGLAEDFEYDESTFTYTLHLRDYAQFSDGSPLTSDDVVFSIETWKTGQYSGVFYSQIDTATVVDDHTVEIKMKQPDTFLPALLTWCTSNVYPASFGGLEADEYFAKPIGAGPFMIDSAEDMGGASERVTLVANPGYWNADSIHIGELDIVTVTDANQRVLRFQSGDVDILEGIGDAEVQQLDPNDVMLTIPQRWTGIALNTASDALSDIAIRQAIAQVIDKKSIADAIGNGAIPAIGILPQNLPDVVGPDDPLPFDADAAETTLVEHPVSRPLRYLYNPADPVSTTTAQVIQSELSEIGVQVQLEGADLATIRALNESDTEWDIVSTYVTGISPSAFDPASLMLSDQYPKTGSDTTVLAAALAEGMAANTTVERANAVKTIQNDAARQAAIIGVADIPGIYAVSDRVSSFAPLPERIWYPDDVALEHKQTEQ